MRLSCFARSQRSIQGFGSSVWSWSGFSVERDLPLALEAISKQRHFFSSAISEVLLADYLRQLKQKHVHESYDLLTDREKEVLQLLAEG